VLPSQSYQLVDLLIGRTSVGLPNHNHAVQDLEGERPARSEIIEGVAKGFRHRVVLVTAFRLVPSGNVSSCHG